ncbi:hypothetical protein PENTCL1PPCAC_20006, partial [Pristionchus entomophagus]
STIYFQPPMKKGARVQTKSKAAPKKKILPKRKKGRSSDKDAHKAKRSATEMKCPECNFRTRSVDVFMKHLREQHSIPLPDWRALSFVRVVPVLSRTGTAERRHGPIRRLNNAKTTPKCVLCEAYPNTVNGYVSHLRIHHKSTLKKNGVYLLCSCGFELEYRDGQGTKSYHMQWKKGCDGREFALKKKVANEESEDEE